MSFPRYPKCKVSGIEWLGGVPEHWHLSPTKRLFRVVGGGTPASDTARFWDGAIPWATPADLGKLATFELSATQRTITREGLDSCNTSLVPPGSLVLSTRAPIGSIGIATVSLCTNQGCKSLVPQSDTSARYYAFAFAACTHALQIRGKGTTFLELSGDELGAFCLPTPPLAEQRAIAAFLDRETAKIDALVADQERLIELLVEKRQAVISHAVTKGLDPTASMQPSGVEWLGKVPAHWVIGPLKRFLVNLDGRRVPLNSEERAGRVGEYPYYGASGIIDYVDDYLFDEGLVLVSEDGANLLNRSTPIAFPARGRYWINNHAHILRPEDPNIVFWAERIDVIDLTPVITGAAQPKLTSDELMRLMVAVPPTHEERASIEAFVMRETARIRIPMEAAELAVKFLQERRSALISAAVTGQIDVRNAVPVEAA